MQTPTTPSVASPSWSDQIEARFRCTLSEDLAGWFDDELWRRSDGGTADRFDSAISPQELLGEAPSAIWPALMPCDFLPLLSNSMGDWLCVRMGNDNLASEIVHWYHGGGDWIPWGNSISEAICFDCVRHRLPGSSRDHAVPADPSGTIGDRSCSLIDQWAFTRLPERAGLDLTELSGDELANAMLQYQLSRPAVLCQLVIDALDNPLLTDDLVRAWPIDDADLVQRGLFDNRLLGDVIESAAKNAKVSPDELFDQQDWQAAERYSRMATEIAPELAWGWDVVGYCRERSGQPDQATALYQRGLGCSVFTDQTVRVRTHGFSGESQKFSAARLMELDYEPANGVEGDYFRCLTTPATDQRRDRVREHFSKLAASAKDGEAHELWKRAGWDMGAEPMLAFAELLEQIALSAERAGRSAQSELAQTHRNCFRDRYRI